VKPEWLVGTFAFNPMLGFRRRLQAASIAHGCATTLVELRNRQVQNPEWTKSWGIRDDLFPDSKGNSPEKLKPLARTAEQRKQGKCWFRNAICPFSPQALKEVRASEITRAEVAEIYRLCGDKLTHEKDAPKLL
jgi:hypothetical protein